MTATGISLAQAPTSVLSPHSNYSFVLEEKTDFNYAIPVSAPNLAQVCSLYWMDGAFVEKGTVCLMLFVFLHCIKGSCQTIVDV